MVQSVKLADDIMMVVRREAVLQSRSVAGQVAHWICIGHAVEKSGYFDHARITAALAGPIETTELATGEKEIWLHRFVERMGQPGPDEEAWFARRRQLDVGVGLDAAGNLVREKLTGEA
ncbi:hypothetical protein FJQ54_05470 [Sandaracinobacter neustonicus]|uniref:ParD-like antitoxin of type II toxin-antitoxin system n=1 Tax=Sandaracinobacter neustonicus TaxID=1715348 RepID=A0A501XRA1_9SPHN|nr:hypothetical protein [Sandaracinobacter neustonicus]TPE62637.1 hypothetical protein FJQ54_05470 [Sandaracinobacter neustonicus]